MAKKAALKKAGKAGRARQAGGASKTRKAGGKFVYQFGRKTDGNGTMKPLLGGKGANLAEMCRIGLPVPPGFTITTARIRPPSRRRCRLALPPSRSRRRRSSGT
jgi:pyruvate,orthophosphate dikinase